MRAVIWGLRKQRHTHRYIHSGFYQALSGIGWHVDWVDDNEQARSVVLGADMVIALGDCSNHLPKVGARAYVLHNFADEAFEEFRGKKLRLQVFTNNSSGEQVCGPHVLFDSSSNTLFQPWGLPPNRHSLMKFPTSPMLVENWIGSIWDNGESQGNQKEVWAYRSEIAKLGISFRHVGSEGPWRFIPAGLEKLGLNTSNLFSVSEERNRVLVNRSALGASVVGKWQKDRGYLPCRVFKNLAAGQPVHSNSDFSKIFPGAFTSDDFFVLASNRLTLSAKEGAQLVADQQSVLRDFTYEAAVSRFLALAQ